MKWFQKKIDWTRPLRQLDRSLLLTVLALMGIGLIQVYSSSYILAIEKYGDGLLFFSRQSVFALISLGLMFIVAWIPWKWMRGIAFLVWLFSFVGIILTFTPLGIKAGGAVRWISLPLGFRVEPSEFFKIGFAMLLAVYVYKQEQRSKWSILAYALMLATPFVFLLKQPDLGSVIICLLVTVSVLFIYGLKWRYLLSGALVGGISFYFLIMNVAYRRDRILGFLDPWSQAQDRGFQVVQSLLGFYSGGITGVGLGQGQSKLFFLPEAHTDFTLAVLGEELGFIGILIILTLYGYLLFRGFQLSFKSYNPLVRAISLAITMLFFYQVFVNIGVATALLPTKGLTLPFLSYGGSSLLATGFLFGILLNAQRYQNHFRTQLEKTH